MSTTQLFVELLVIGSGVLIWVALLVAGSKGCKFDTSILNMKLPIWPLLIAAAYVLGILLDRITYKVSEKYKNRYEKEEIQAKIEKGILKNKIAKMILGDSKEPIDKEILKDRIETMIHKNEIVDKLLKVKTVNEILLVNTEIKLNEIAKDKMALETLKNMTAKEIFLDEKEIKLNEIVKGKEQEEIIINRAAKDILLDQIEKVIIDLSKEQIEKRLLKEQIKKMILVDVAKVEPAVIERIVANTSEPLNYMIHYNMTRSRICRSWAINFFLIGASFFFWQIRVCQIGHIYTVLVLAVLVFMAVVSWWAGDTLERDNCHNIYWSYKYIQKQKGNERDITGEDVTV
jgi:hypothetical protein